MRTGFVTDSHLGLHGASDNDVVRDVYRNILDYFREENIQNVVHLGDCVDERTEEPVKQMLEDIVGELTDFENAFVTPGNHDVIGLNQEDFGSYDVITPPAEIYRTEDKSALLVETSVESEYKNVGFVTEESIELIEQNLERGLDVTLISHFPLDYTEIRSEVFNFVPEKAFPVNKIDLRDVQSENPGSIQRMFCGHLHPDSTGTEKTPVLQSNQTVIEPITSMTLEDRELSIGVNESINPENLVFQI